MVMPHNLDHIRIAIIEKPDYTTNSCDIIWLDNFQSKRSRVKFPQPYAGRGWGILTGVEQGTIAIVGFQEQGQPIIIGYMINNLFNQPNILASPDINVGELPYPPLRMGEIALQSKFGSNVFLQDDGAISFSTVTGTSIELNANYNTIYQRSLQYAVANEAGTLTMGMIKRSLNPDRNKDKVVENLSDWGPEYDSHLNIITDVINKKLRYNPVNNNALTEWKLSISEKADSRIFTNDDDEGTSALNNRIATVVLGTTVGSLEDGINNGYLLDIDGERITNQNSYDLAGTFKLKLYSHDGTGTGKQKASKWELVVDKEGRTKLTIPASSGIGGTVAGKSLEITADGKIEIDGTEINWNGGTKGVARLEDEITIDATTATAFMSFIQALPGGGAITSITGKISSSSDTVKAGD